MVKRWNEFLNEYVDYNRIKELSVELDLAHMLDYEQMYVLRNIMSNPTVYVVENDILVKTNKTLFKQDVLIENYMNYYREHAIQHSEIIKIEYSNYNWITLFLCYTRTDKHATVSYSPDLKNTESIAIINDYLEEKNFHTVKNKPMVNKFSSKFTDKLVSVFRDISGRYFSTRILSRIKNDFEEFKAENAKEWKAFQGWKLKNLGSRQRAVRYMDMSPNFTFHLTDGTTKTTKELTADDEFYYPISGRDFSQWAAIDTNLKDILKGLVGISASGRFGIISNLPTSRIVMTNKLLPHNFSPHVNEREIIVEHSPDSAYDELIICKIAQ